MHVQGPAAHETGQGVSTPPQSSDGFAARRLHRLSNRLSGSQRWPIDSSVSSRQHVVAQQPHAEFRQCDRRQHRYSVAYSDKFRTIIGYRQRCFNFDSVFQPGVTQSAGYGGFGPKRNGHGQLQSECRVNIQCNSHHYQQCFERHQHCQSHRRRSNNGSGGNAFRQPCHLERWQRQRWK